MKIVVYTLPLIQKSSESVHPQEIFWRLPFCSIPEIFRHLFNVPFETRDVKWQKQRLGLVAQGVHCASAPNHRRERNAEM